MKDFMVGDISYTVYWHDKRIYVLASKGASTTRGRKFLYRRYLFVYQLVLSLEKQFSGKNGVSDKNVLCYNDYMIMTSNPRDQPVSIIVNTDIYEVFLNIFNVKNVCITM